jgi:hypothetical protein
VGDGERVQQCGCVSLSRFSQASFDGRFECCVEVEGGRDGNGTSTIDDSSQASTNTKQMLLCDDNVVSQPLLLYDRHHLLHSPLLTRSAGSLDLNLVLVPV